MISAKIEENELIQAIDREIAEVMSEVEILESKRQELYNAVWKKNIVEKHIEDIGSRYEKNKVIFDEIEDDILEKTFSLPIRLLLGLRYSGKSINKNGIIQLTFFSERLSRYIYVDYTL